MSKRLVLELPDSIHDAIARVAARRGKELEELACDWLSAGARLADEDPLERFIGCVNSDAPEWGRGQESVPGVADAAEAAEAGQSALARVPEALHKALLRLAEVRGQRPEELAAAWLEGTAKRVEADPVERTIGCLALNDPGWAENHDALLADIYAAELGRRSEEGDA